MDAGRKISSPPPPALLLSKIATPTGEVTKGSGEKINVEHIEAHKPTSSPSQSAGNKRWSREFSQGTSCRKSSKLGGTLKM